MSGTEATEAMEGVQAPQAEPPAVPCADQPLGLRVEAVLLTNDRPVTEQKLVEMLGLKVTGKGKDSAAAQVREAIESLNAQYQSQGRAFRIERLAGGFQLLTLPAFGPLLARVRGLRAQGRLTPAALETLAIIAYRQPLLRSELEAIRGVACGEVLKSLLERRLIRITGRAEELGRPMLYGTTTEFLKVFGLSRIEDLPQAKELKAPKG
ncbi:MAG: SMC-Scp complex subunit ScpB [Planctomycetes bacterium]|nr:SMC-Scp complex subunit ScpB [Planctomycetota bacterium]